MKKTISTISVTALLLILVVVPSIAVASSSNCELQSRPPLESIIQDVRGGFGVKATISNYQLAWGNRPVHWMLTVEGEHVFFGTSSGSVDSMSAGQARTRLFPPTFGWGPVTVTIKVTVRTGQPDEGIISMTQRSGFMIGPIILLI